MISATLEWVEEARPKTTECVPSEGQRADIRQDVAHHVRIDDAPNGRSSRVATRLLQQQIRRTISDSARLRWRSAALRKDLREAVARIRDYRTEWNLSQLSVFPEGEFTIQDLERASRSVAPEVVRIELAAAIKNRHVNFFERNENNGRVRTMKYRTTSKLQNEIASRSARHATDCKP